MAKTRLVVQHRPMNSIEEGEMKRRLTLLEPLGDEEDEEEISQGEGNTDNAEQNGTQSQVSVQVLVIRVLFSMS